MTIPINTIIQGDALKVLKTFPDESIDCIVTSPPYYGLRDYGTATWEGGDNECDHKIPDIEMDKMNPKGGNSHTIRFNREKCHKCGAKRIDQQIGLEKTLDEYLEKMLAITAELRRVLKKEGTMWWNHGDSYNSTPVGNKEIKNEGDGVYGRLMKRHTQGGAAETTRKALIKSIPEKCLTMQNERLIMRMIDEQGWILRNRLIWWKPNCMPSSVKDRFTVDYEPVFFFTKAKKYWFEPQYEPVQQVSIDRLFRAVSNKHKWLGGANGQSAHTMSQPRPNRNTKIPADMVEIMGSPRARYKRYEKSNAPHEFENGDHLVSPFNPQLGRNKRSVWKIPTQPYSETHFATFPEKLIMPMIKAGCPEFICKKCGKAREAIFEASDEYKKLLGKSWHDHSNDKEMGATQKTGISTTADYRKTGYTDCKCNAPFVGGIVLDPFMGSGTTALVARALRRQWIGIELSGEYIKLAEKQLRQQTIF